MTSENLDPQRNFGHPVPRRLVSRLWYAFLGVALFFGVVTVQGLLRPGYDALQQSVSALSLGPGGWVQQVNFVFLGVVLLWTCPAWKRILAGGEGAAAYPAVTAISALSLVLLGFVPQDPAPGYDPEALRLEGPTPGGLIHLALAAVMAACSVIGLLVMAQRFVNDEKWRGWSLYTRLTALAVVGCVAVYAVWSTRATGLAGVFERLAFTIPTVWAGTLLVRLSAGTPFMRSELEVEETRRIADR